MTRIPVPYLAIAATAFAVALLLLGPATQHPQAGPVTHAVYAVVLLAGFLSLGVAAVVQGQRRR